MRDISFYTWKLLTSISLRGYLSYNPFNKELVQVQNPGNHYSERLMITILNLFHYLCTTQELQFVLAQTSFVRVSRRSLWRMKMRSMSTASRCCAAYFPISVISMHITCGLFWTVTSLQFSLVFFFLLQFLVSFFWVNRLRHLYHLSKYTPIIDIKGLQYHTVTWVKAEN